MIAAVVADGRVSCGRPGCGRTFGSVEGPAIRLHGVWRPSFYPAPRRWRFDRPRGSRERDAGGHRLVEYQWEAAGQVLLSVDARDPMARFPTTVQCPRCRAVQLVDLVNAIGT